MMLFNPDEERKRARERSIYTFLGLKNTWGIFTDFRPNMDTLFQLGLLDKVRFNVFPEDIERNESERDDAFIGELENMYKDKKRVYIWVSRLNLDKKDFGSYKAAEVYAEALADFIETDASKDIGFLVLDHGYQSEEFKAILQHRGVIDQVQFLPSQPHSKLLSILSLKNGVLFDCMDGVKGEIGGASREAISLGMPCFRTYDEELIEMGYGELPPLADVSNREDCINKMTEISQLSEQEFQNLKDQVKDWAYRRLHYPNNIADIILHLKKVVYTHRSSQTLDIDFKEEFTKVKKLGQLAHRCFHEKESIPFQGEVKKWATALGYPQASFRNNWPHYEEPPVQPTHPLQEKHNGSKSP